MPENASVNAMVRVREILQSITVGQQVGSYREIYRLVECYISANCLHEYIEDYIDISLDSTKRIMYCKHCYYTRN